MIFMKLLTIKLNKVYSLNKSIKQLFIKKNLNNILSSRRHIMTESMNEKELISKENLWMCQNKCEQLYGQLFLTQRQYQQISADMFSNLSLDKSLIESIINVYNTEKYTTERVPSTLRPIDVKALSQMNDYLRKSFLNKLFKEELQKWFLINYKMKNEIKLEDERIAKLGELKADLSGVFNSDKQLIYQLNHNCLTLEFNDLIRKKYLTHKLSSAALFGSKLVIDCSFDELHELYESQKFLRFFNELVDYNCYDTKEAFDLYFCNIDFNSVLFNFLSQNLENVTQKQFGLNYMRESYLDLFPKHKLIYISQYSDQIIHEFDSEAVYVLPMVPLFYSIEAAVKAKKEGVRVCRLPLNEYGFFNKSKTVEFLSLAELAAVLHDIRSGSDWSKAFNKNMNKLYIDFADDIAEKDRIRIRNLKSKKLHNKISKNQIIESLV